MIVVSFGYKGCDFRDQQCQAGLRNYVVQAYDL